MILSYFAQYGKKRLKMRGRGILVSNNYDLQINVKKDAAGKITSGLRIGNTLYQNQALILILQPGELKLNPIVGVGLENIVMDNDYLGWRKKIRQQMELDQQDVRDVSFGRNQQLKIDASYS